MKEKELKEAQKLIDRIEKDLAKLKAIVASVPDPPGTGDDDGD